MTELLLDRLDELGVTATVDGENLRLRPASAIPDELLEEVKVAKPVLLDKLRDRCGICGLRETHHDLDEEPHFKRPPDSERCEKCRELEADGVTVLACSVCDVEVGP